MNMKTIRNYIKDMSVDDALFFFHFFAMALVVFALMAGYVRIISLAVAEWLFFSGMFAAIGIAIVLFARKDFFMHDLTEDAD